MMNWNTTASAMLAGLLAAFLSLEVGATTTSGASSTTETVFTGPRAMQSLGTESPELLDQRAAAFSAKIEVERSMRILDGFRNDGSHLFAAYLEKIEAALSPFQGRSTLDPASLLFLTTTLSASRAFLETKIEDVHTWRRFARMVEPAAQLIRVPPRFVGRIHVDAPPLERLSDVERSIWLTDT